MQTFVYALIPVSVGAILNGKPATIDQFPFVGALMDCSTTGSPPECIFVCAGAMVSSNAFITAGSCLEELGENPGHVIPVTPLANLHVLLGTADLKNLSSGHLYKVARYFNKGFGHNMRFPSDDDVGLVYLESCAEEIPGKVEFIRIGLDETKCGEEITIAGFGFGTNLDFVFGVDATTSKLLAGPSTVHSHRMCSEMFVESRQALALADHQTLQQALITTWKQAIVPDTFLCASGSTSTCFGDRGSPAIKRKSDGTRVLVGVNSFGSTSDKYCGGGPDYFQKLAGHANWIWEHLDELSCSFQQKSFDQPLKTEQGVSVKLHDTRCLGEKSWQCALGECIDPKFRCTAYKDCSDGSDEMFCKSSRVVERPAEGPSRDWMEVERLARRRFGYKIIYKKKSTSPKPMEELIFTQAPPKPMDELIFTQAPPKPMDELVFPKKRAKHIYKRYMDEPSWHSCIGAKTDILTFVDAYKMGLAKPTQDGDLDSTSMDRACNLIPHCHIEGMTDSDLVIGACEGLRDYRDFMAHMHKFKASIGTRFPNECTIRILDEGEYTPEPVAVEWTGGIVAFLAIIVLIGMFFVP